MNWLVVNGVLQLTVGSLTGWGMVYIVRTPRERRRAAGLNDPRRWRQGHIEMLMQGTIMVALGAALTEPPLIPAILVAVFGWLAPLSFFPVAFRPAWGERRLYTYTDNAILVGLTIGWVTLAVAVVARFV